MGQEKLQRSLAAVWPLAARQHGVVSREQLLAMGIPPSTIDHWIATWRLHPVGRGVYAVGRPSLPRKGTWTAAVLACGENAVLTDDAAGALWEVRRERRLRPIDVSVPTRQLRNRPGIRVHRRLLDPRDVTRHHGIPVTTPARTLLDLARTLTPGQLEAAINEADKRDLITPERLRDEMDRFRGVAGAPALRSLLDRRTFVLTDSELERRFLPIARHAGLGRPSRHKRVNGFKVDFFWPDLGLVVETDGLRYHRTPAQQARDRLRDQAHFAAGLTPLRFTHAQVRYEPAHVRRTLEAVARRLRQGRADD